MHALLAKSPARAARRAVLTAAVAAGALAAAAPMATVAHAAAPSAVTGGADIAYQANDNFLQTVTPDGTVHEVALGMAAGASPSITQLPGGTYWTVMRANTGALWSVNPQLVGEPERATVAAGTSPSTSYDATDGTIQTYFQSSPGALGHLSGFGGNDLLAGAGFKIDPGTSPSVSNGSEANAAGGVVSYSGPALGDPQVAAGTSPSDAFLPGADFTENVEAVAWQHADAQGNLRYAIIRGGGASVTAQTFKPSLGLMPGTSPAIAIQPDGRYEVAFQSSQGELWIVGSDGVGHDTRLGMDSHSSPAITALPGGGFEAAFQANTHALWTVDGSSFTGQDVPGAIMAPGTSPSISANIPVATKTAPVPAQQVKTYTVANCSNNDVFTGNGMGRPLLVWVKDDSVAGSSFVQAGDLPGLVTPANCGDPGVKPATYSFSPVPGHSYEVNVTGASTEDQQCAGTPTSCLQLSETFAGSATGAIVTRDVHVS